MINNFLFAIDDIFSNYKKFIAGFLQIMVTFIFFAIVASKVKSLFMISYIEKNMVIDNEVYTFMNCIPADIGTVINDEEKRDKLINLWKEVSSDDMLASYGAKIYVADNESKITINDARYAQSGIAKKNSLTADNRSLKLEVTANFFDIFSLKGNFVPEYKEVFSTGEDDGVTPVILGYSFAKIYEIGDSFKDEKDDEYRIIGFLNKDSYYLYPSSLSGEPVDLGGYVIIPAKLDADEATDVCRLIDGIYVISNTPDYCDYVQRRMAEEELFTLDVRSFTYELESGIEYLKDGIKVNGFLGGIVCVFAFMGLVGNLVQYISDYKREFAINMLCGSDKAGIITRIYVQLLLLVIFGIIPTVILYGKSVELMCTVVFAIIFSLGIMAYPLSLIRRFTIEEMLKRGTE